MTKTSVPGISATQSQVSQNWIKTAGAFLGIGTSPGALLLGAGIAERYGHSIPILSILLSFLIMAMIVWFQGMIGLPPPLGDGMNLTQVAPFYLGSVMQRILGAIIAIGMIGWFGFNIGLGAAALSALVHLPLWGAVILLGVPIISLSMGGLRSWNWLAALTTISVLVLVGLVVFRLAAREMPVTLQTGEPADLIIDIATFVGYISVFTLRSPDFTSNLKTRSDLAVSILLLTVPLILIALAGVGLQQGTGSANLVDVLSGPHGLAIGNLLITLSVIAPTFTISHSGAPAMRAAIGINERTAMLVIGIIGLLLALARFDLWLLSWLSILAAVLPPFLVPLSVEASRRRRGRNPHLVPLWAWLPGAILAFILTAIGYPLAPLAGLALAVVVTGCWYLFMGRSNNE
jgi:cytosine permease